MSEPTCPACQMGGESCHNHRSSFKDVFVMVGPPENYVGPGGIRYAACSDDSRTSPR